MSHKESIGDMAHRLKKMISEPASKEWFEKHGLPGKKKEMAQKMGDGKMSKAELVARFHARQAKKHGGMDNYKKSIAEGKEKMRAHMAKGQNMGNNPSESYKRDYQKRIGRAYSE